MLTFEQTYDQSIKAIRDLVEDIRFSRTLNLDAVKISADYLCQYLHTNNNILNILSCVADKNPYMYAHPINVAIISYVIGKWLHLTDTKLYHLVCSGMLHDIGKAKIRDSILNRPCKLSEREMEIIRNHPIMGFHIVADMDAFEEDVLLGILSHHERQDGTGYPNHLKGDQINLFGRIIAIADIYDAMTSTKPYNSKSTPFKVVEEIEESSFGALDPQICQVFLKNIINFYPGIMVRLNNEKVGEIIYVNPAERTKPIVHCGDEYFNMTQERYIEIVEMLVEHAH